MERGRRNQKMEREDLVLDAPVIIKWFTQEEDKERAIELREKFIKGDVEIVCPDLILYELTNALRHNQKFNQEDVEKAAESLSEMELTIVLPLTKINFSRRTAHIKHNFIAIFI